MQGKQRRGRRPMVTTFVSERRVPGGREFVFSSTDPVQGRDARPARALQTGRAFSWEGDAPAANDTSIAPGQAVPDQEHDYLMFLRGLRGVYRAPRRRR